MTSKIVVNNIEADSGINTVTFASNIQGNLIGNVTGTVNSTGVITATSFSGDVTGNVTGNLTGTASTATAAATAYGISGSPTLSGITSVSTTNLTVNGNAYPSAGPLSNRNLIINGSMEIAQRGTSSSSNGYVSLDRWYVNQSGGSTTFSQETFAVGSEIEGISTYGKLVVSSSSDYTNILQRIEDVKSIPTGTVTVSFWAKGTAPSGGLNIWIVQNFGSGGSVDVDIAPEDVSLTATWTKYSVNFTIPSISGKTIGSSNFLQVAFGQYSNTGTTAWELNITGVQLEVGTVATPFEHRSFGQELALCQRYYWKTYLDNTVPGSVSQPGAFMITVPFVGNSVRLTHPFKVQMRAAPTFTFYNPETGTAGFAAYEASGATNQVGMSQTYTSEYAGLMYATSAGFTGSLYWHAVGAAEL